MENDKVIVSYYKETLPEIIEKLKEMVENNLLIVGKNISVLLKDNKIKLALESRRLAVEDIIWACKEIDAMEGVLQDVTQGEKLRDDSFYKSIIPKLITEIKGMVANNLKIVGREISGLSDDQLKQAILSRRIGAEDSVWASKQVDTLERDLKGEKQLEDEEVIINWSKAKATKK